MALSQEKIDSILETAQFYGLDSNSIDLMIAEEEAYMKAMEAEMEAEMEAQANFNYY